MATASERAGNMRAVVGYEDGDVALVRESMGLLAPRIGTLMAAVKENLLQGPGEEHLFGDDPDRAQAFGSQLAEFVMRASAGNFTGDYCDYVAGFAGRLPEPPPVGAFVASTAIISSWIATSLGEALKETPEKLPSMLTAWQRMLAVNLELLLSGLRPA